MPDDFLNGMKNFVNGWCEREARIRRANEGRRRCVHEIGWMQNKISELEKKLVNRPSTIKEINNLKHQIREHEVKLAFDPYLNPDWKCDEN
jgi:wobble nucleotide-excising tRNase